MKKHQKYENILKQADRLIFGEDLAVGNKALSKNHLISDLANLTALIKHFFDFLWVGFYLAEKEELYLGPFQGPLACTKIPFGRGVCGKAALEQKTIIVENVHEFPDHIACSSKSQSEIVVPLIFENKTKLVLDIDSETLNTFDKVDQNYLESLLTYIQKQHYDLSFS